MGGELVKFGRAAGRVCAGAVLGGWGCGCTGEAAMVREHKWILGGEMCGAGLQEGRTGAEEVGREKLGAGRSGVSPSRCPGGGCCE